MKSIILICLLVAFCSAQRVPSNILNQATQAVKNAKSRVDTIMYDIKRNSQMHKMNTENEISTLHTNSFLSISNIESTRINDINKKIDEAKAAGNNAAADCLNDVASKMRTAGREGFKDIDQCRAEGNKRVADDIAKYNAATATGQQLQNQLDRVVLGCYKSDVFEMANCIFIQMAAINIEIREYENTVNQLTRNMQSNKGNIVVSVQNCNLQATREVSAASFGAIYAAAACLKD